jgi:hypothetical protein
MANSRDSHTKLEVSLLPGEAINELKQTETPQLSDAELNSPDIPLARSEECLRRRLSRIREE